MNSGRKATVNALMSFQLQFSLLTAHLLENTVQPRLLTERTEEIFFMVTHKCVYLCLLKCNLTPEAVPLAQLGKHAAQATHFNEVLTSSYSRIPLWA